MEDNKDNELKEKILQELESPFMIDEPVFKTQEIKHNKSNIFY